MNEVILVFYVGQKGGDHIHIKQQMHNVSRHVDNRMADSKIKSFFLPVDEPFGTIRVECLNPKLMTGEEYDDIKTKLATAEASIAEYMNSQLGDDNRQ